MRKRLLLFSGLLALALLGGYLVLWWTAPRHPLGWRGYQKIELGMTERQVEEALGAPPGSHLDLPEGEKLVYDHAAEVSRGRSEAPRGLSWVSNEGNLGVAFDEAGRVVGVTFTPLRRANVPLLDRLRRWLGLTP